MDIQVRLKIPHVQHSKVKYIASLLCVPPSAIYVAMVSQVLDGADLTALASSIYKDRFCQESRYHPTAHSENKESEV